MSTADRLHAIFDILERSDARRDSLKYELGCTGQKLNDALRLRVRRGWIERVLLEPLPTDPNLETRNPMFGLTEDGRFEHMGRRDRSLREETRGQRDNGGGGKPDDLTNAKRGRKRGRKGDEECDERIAREYRQAMELGLVKGQAGFVRQKYPDKTKSWLSILLNA
jgi:hypothetical protein